MPCCATNSEEQSQRQPSLHGFSLCHVISQNQIGLERQEPEGKVYGHIHHLTYCQKLPPDFQQLILPSSSSLLSRGRKKVLLILIFSLFCFSWMAIEKRENPLTWLLSKPFMEDLANLLTLLTDFKEILFACFCEPESQSKRRAKHPS